MEADFELSGAVKVMSRFAILICHHERPPGREGSAVFPSVVPRTNEEQIPRFTRNDNSIEATIAR